MSDPAKLARRDLLTRGASALGIAAASALVARRFYDRGGWQGPQSSGRREVRDFRVRNAPGPSDFAIAHAALAGATPTQLTRHAVDALGGMARFISRGDRVVIKPNIGWDRTPLQAANTNPEVVAAVVTMAFEAGAHSVIVTDASCNEPGRCFQRSGIWTRAHRAGAQVLLPAEHRFRTMRLRGEVLDEWPVYRTLIEADKVINVPVAKHHNLAKYTAAMKNWYGVLGGRRNRLHQSIDRSIADLATFMRPTLTIVDAIRVMLRNGPQGGNVDDTQRTDTVIATVDQVAADAFGCTLIGQRPENLPYLHMGQARGLGTMDWRTLRPRELAFDGAGALTDYALAIPDDTAADEAAFAIGRRFLTPSSVILA
ncbi:MAG: DUF362 domain-containing protein [Deltaproteobacteria bacterium]|nr:DUF362 domain-containing protein [Deltaproteobacteria bacterium]